MYFPYLRGKQNELILLRENAELIAEAGFTPIIEPVKANLNPIKKCITALIQADAEFLLIANPRCGDLTGNYNELLAQLLVDEVADYPKLILGYIFDEGANLDEFVALSKHYSSLNFAIIHYGYSNGKELRYCIEGLSNIAIHIFIEDHAQKRYRRNFNSGIKRVLIRDGFHKRNNREHPTVEHFSELHLMYEDEGMDAFGDYLIAGDEYSESGGPAYAVAIHLTYLDSEDEDDMFIKHYVSDRTNSPADPGGKFLEALAKLIMDVESDDKIYKSLAVGEFERLNSNQHYPGLGAIKKLSMQHHVELLAYYFSKERE